MRLLGLARRAGALRMGAHDVLKALSRERPGVVFLARDAGGDLVKKVRRNAGASLLDEETFDVESLAAAFHRERLSVVSVHQTGFVKGIRELLSD